MNMRKLIQIVEAKGASHRFGRDIFIYLEPKKDKDKKDFAQCATCFMFMPGKERCSIFPEDYKVIAEASCSLYVKGMPTDHQSFQNAVDPDDAGYVKGQVRCENCKWLDPGNRCGFFAYLNEKMNDTFNCKESVNPKGCCNAWEAKS
jgi:hypothetical protein